MFFRELVFDVWLTFVVVGGDPFMTLFRHRDRIAVVEVVGEVYLQV